jgi:signal transduction histidine kinase
MATTTVPDGDAAPGPADGRPTGHPPWTVVVDRGGTASDGHDARAPRVLLPIVVAALAVLLLVAVVGSYAARRLAEREAVNDAGNTANLLAEAVVQPALRDRVVAGDSAAVASVAEALEPYLAESPIVRIKLWTRDGRIVWSDEPRLVGARFDLSPDQLHVFDHPATGAEVSDLEEPENRFERGNGRLLEVYRPVWTPDGTPLLFETYTPYDEVTARSGQLWRGFAGVTVSSLLLLVVLLAPVMWRLLRRLRSSQRQREALLQRAVDASAEERRRIAGTLHDGVVQELVATTYAVDAGAARADAAGDRAAAGRLRSAAATLRGSIRGLRSLLVDLYPPSLEASGLAPALTDLAAALRPRGVDVRTEVDPGVDLTAEEERVVYRVARECLNNAGRHSGASHVEVALRRDGDGAVLEVVDDGRGFDAGATLAQPPEGHLGLRVIADVASAAGAELAVATAPGAGCRWRLRLP